VAQDDVERAGCEFGRGLTAAEDQVHPLAYLGRLPRQHGRELREQLIGGVQAGHLMASPGQRKSLRALPAADVQDPGR